MAKYSVYIDIADVFGVIWYYGGMNRVKEIDIDVGGMPVYFRRMLRAAEGGDSRLCGGRHDARFRGLL